jgi:class I fructose-bisphosphate aldolase
VKPPTAHIEQEEARKVYEAEGIKVDTLEDRIRHVCQACFNGRRIVIFSGGAAKGTEAVMEEIRGIHAGGGFGSIIGRNSFQRPHDDGVKLLQDIMDIYAS